MSFYSQDLLARQRRDQLRDEARGDQIVARAAERNREENGESARPTRRLSLRARDRWHALVRRSPLPIPRSR